MNKQLIELQMYNSNEFLIKCIREYFQKFEDRYFKVFIECEILCSEKYIFDDIVELDILNNRIKATIQTEINIESDKFINAFFEWLNKEGDIKEFLNIVKKQKED